MLSVAIILAIALAIFLGYKTKINTGLFCIVFAYIIGCFVMGLKPKQVIGYWPTSTMFGILSVSLFYNFAAINGTLEKMSGALLYACRKFPGLLPYALLAVAVILSVMGATYFTVLAFLAPITLVICDESRMDKLTGAVAINCGALAGGNFPTSNLGVIFRGLADTAFEASPDVAAVETFGMEMKIFLFSVLFSLVLVTIFRFGFKENRNIGKGVTFKKPAVFTKDQKITLSLMMIMMVVVLIFPLMQILMPGNAAIQYIRKRIGYDDFLKEYAFTHQINRSDLNEVLAEIEEAAKAFSSVEEWFAHVEEYTETLKVKEKERNRPRPGVRLMTIHASKGLEFKQVFLIAANEGRIPYQKAKTDKEIEEERRLFYVAMTRAKDFLKICYVKIKNGKEVTPSRFVDELLKS